MKTTELDSNKYDPLIAQAYFILMHQNDENYKRNPEFLRGNRNHFWKAIDNHYSFQRNIENKRIKKINEIVKSLILENNIHLSNLSSKLDDNLMKHFILTKNQKKRVNT